MICARPIHRFTLLLLTYLLLTAMPERAFGVNDRFRIGLIVSPGFSWLKPQGKELGFAKMGYSMNYGLQFEYYFHENYGISTGLFGGMDGGTVNGRNLFEQRDSVTRIGVNEKYTFQSVQVPVLLKLRTNEIKRFVVFGEVGFTLNGVVSSRATYSESVPDVSGNWYEVTKENILRKDNEVTKTIPGFRTGFFDFRIQAGGGFEYAVSGRTSVLFGIYYQNGFINMVNDKDAKKEKMLMRSIQFRTGIIF